MASFVSVASDSPETVTLNDLRVWTLSLIIRIVGNLRGLQSDLRHNHRDSKHSKRIQVEGLFFLAMVTGYGYWGPTSLPATDNTLIDCFLLSIFELSHQP